jgi:hypothetical protein
MRPLPGELHEPKAPARPRKPGAKPLGRPRLYGPSGERLPPRAPAPPQAPKVQLQKTVAQGPKPDLSGLHPRFHDQRRVLKVRCFRRAHRDDVIVAVLEICSYEWMTAQEIGAALLRDWKTIRIHYLYDLVDADLMEIENRGQYYATTQKYRTTLWGRDRIEFLIRVRVGDLPVCKPSASRATPAALGELKDLVAEHMLPPGHVARR